MFLELIFCDNFFYFQLLQNVFAVKVIKPTSLIGPKFEAQIFVCIDEGFAIN